MPSRVFPHHGERTVTIHNLCVNNPLWAPAEPSAADKTHALLGFNAGVDTHGSDGNTRTRRRRGTGATAHITSRACGRSSYPSPVIIWINGPMGVGKTQVAHELAHRIINSFVCDPELLGVAIRRMNPPVLRNRQWQEFPHWRCGVRQIAHDVASGYDGLVVMPGTLLNEDHHDEIVGGLRRLGHEVQHISLMASAETVRKRLRVRGQGKRSEAAARITVDLQRLSRPQFATHVDTDDLSVCEAAEEVSRLLDLRLGPSGNAVQQRLRRLSVTVRHIR